MRAQPKNFTKSMYQVVKPSPYIQINSDSIHASFPPFHFLKEVQSLENFLWNSVVRSRLMKVSGLEKYPERKARESKKSPGSVPPGIEKM